MSTLVREAIEYALTRILAPNMNTIRARVMMLTIQKQEDPEERRYQVVRRVAGTLPENIVGPKTAKGPARGLWQFEQGGGVRGVLRHEKTEGIANAICTHFNIHPSPTAVWSALEGSDVLAACFARLLLWTDRGNLPTHGEPEKAFELYLRVWRPGAYANGTDQDREKLHQKFLKNHAAAVAEMGLA